MGGIGYKRMSIVTIIVILIVIGLLGCLLEWIRDNIVPILIVAAIILGLIFYRKPTIGIVCVSAIGNAIYMFVRRVLVPLFQRIRNGFVEKKKVRLLAREAKNEEKRLKHELQESMRRENETIAALPDGSREFIRLSKTFSDELEQEKKRINDQEMVRLIVDCQEVVNEICSEIKLFPEASSRLNKLTSYYYPTISKLVQKYSVYEQRRNDENNVKREIVSTMEEINQALSRVADNIKGSDDIDILSDISVMKQMIERDGLKNDFNSLK